MRKLIGTIIILLAALIAYMYFFGHGENKEKAHSIVNETITSQRRAHASADPDVEAGASRRHEGRLRGAASRARRVPSRAGSTAAALVRQP